MDDFTDAVESHVSFPDAHRLIAGLGVSVDTTRAWSGGQFSLRGSLDVERTFSDAETFAWVSEERLSSKSTKSGVLMSLDRVYRKGHFWIGAAVTADAALGSDTRDYAGFLKFGIRL